jgi:hypothetical protein
MMLVLLARLIDDCALAVAASVTARCDAIVRESFVLSGMKRAMGAFGNRGRATEALPAYYARS